MFGKCRSPICSGERLQKLVTIADLENAGRAFAQEADHLAPVNASGQHGLPVCWRLQALHLTSGSPAVIELMPSKNQMSRRLRW